MQSRKKDVSKVSNNIKFSVPDLFKGHNFIVLEAKNLRQLLKL